MIKVLSYMNLIFAVLYFLQYLQNGSTAAITGILAVVVFNWMVLRNLEEEQVKWFVVQCILAGISFLFALYLGYSAMLLLINDMVYNYYPLNTIWIITQGLLFTSALLFHLFLCWSEFINKKF